jgi:hypothetical protein
MRRSQISELIICDLIINLQKPYYTIFFEARRQASKTDDYIKDEFDIVPLSSSVLSHSSLAILFKMDENSLEIC